MSSVISFIILVYVILLYVSGIRARETETWYDPILGCLDLTSEWYSSARPLNTLPESREKINTGFILQTKEEPGLEKDVYICADDLSTITASTFNPDRPTKFVIHGFMDDGNKKWIKNFAQSLLGHGDYNVIRVDWGDGSKIDYIAACANIRVVGLEISHLVNNLIRLYNLDSTTVHLIGHSLGAHAGGYAGEDITNLGRITGMDPAGPGFSDTETFIRLDPSDATFVDTIHTDGDTIFLFGLGTKQPMGHISFFPNGGHEQPGCGLFELAGFWNWVNGPRDLVSCNHQRAVSFFEETLLGNTCQWLGHECTDYDAFKKGLCTSCKDDNSACAYLGIKADIYATAERELVQMFIDTSEEPFFCRVHYVLEVLTEAQEDAEDTVVGNLRITLYGTNGSILESTRITQKHEKIDHGSIIRYMFITDKEIEEVLMVDLEWNYNDTLNPGTYCNLFCNRSLYAKSIQLSPGSVYPESARIASTYVGCSSNGSTTEMQDGKIYSFFQNDECTPVEG